MTEDQGFAAVRDELRATAEAIAIVAVTDPARAHQMRDELWTRGLTLIAEGVPRPQILAEVLLQVQDLDALSEVSS